jgi:hypothetical protein
MGRKDKKARVVSPATSLEQLIELPPGRRVVRTLRACVVPELALSLPIIDSWSVVPA